MDEGKALWQQSSLTAKYQCNLLFGVNSHRQYFGGGGQSPSIAKYQCNLLLVINFNRQYQCNLLFALNYNKEAWRAKPPRGEAVGKQSLWWWWWGKKDVWCVTIHLTCYHHACHELVLCVGLSISSTTHFVCMCRPSTRVSVFSFGECDGLRISSLLWLELQSSLFRCCTF